LYKGKILLLKRGSEVGSYQGKWAAVSGYIEEEPEKQAYKELLEETYLRREDVSLRSKAKSITVVDKELETKWVVHPFLFEVKNARKIRLDWEHVEARWVEPKEIRRFDTVPFFYETLENVLRSQD